VGLADGTLTFEDAPPGSYGGKPVALTCKPCNNSFGSSVDASLARYDSQFVSPSTIAIGGVEVSAYQEIRKGGRISPSHRIRTIQRQSTASTRSSTQGIPLRGPISP
jgi:hypothetical protein